MPWHLRSDLFSFLDRNFPWQSSDGQNATVAIPQCISLFTTAWTGCSAADCRTSVVWLRCQEKRITIMSIRLQYKVNAATQQEPRKSMKLCLLTPGEHLAIEVLALMSRPHADLNHCSLSIPKFPMQFQLYMVHFLYQTDM